MFMNPRQNPNDIVLYFFKWKGSSGRLLTQLCDMETKFCLKNTRAFAKPQITDCVFEFWYHGTRQEFPKVSAFALAVGMAVSHFGEWHTSLQLRQCHADSHSGRSFTLLIVYVLYPEFPFWLRVSQYPTSNLIALATFIKQI